MEAIAKIPNKSFTERRERRGIFSRVEKMKSVD
jgi:hypothetical protein